MLGLLISFDGIDSSGKQTQAELLREKFAAIGHRVIKIATPDYSTASGQELKRLFQGLNGGWDGLPWQEQMKKIADNRAEHKTEVISTLNAGGIVIYDRYVPSSIAHMSVSAARAGEENPRAVATATVRDYEYQTNQMPVENLSIFLDVPPQAAQDLLNSRKQTLAEADEQTDELSLQQEIYQEYIHLTSQDADHFLRITCTNENGLLSPQEIHQKIWQETTRRFSSLEK